MFSFFRNTFGHPKTSFFGILAGIAQVAGALAIAPGPVGKWAGIAAGVATALTGMSAADHDKVVTVQ